MEQAIEGSDAVRSVKRGRPAKVAVIESPESITPAQAYALRIWEGQSVDLPTHERVERVVNGLRGQNLSIDVTLPHPDAARCLDKYK
jgi:hypothetical protein